ncbi:hypothetical protein DW121_03095 [Bacteroides sp. AM10-21B]|nr:hypothetical protein DXC20_01670 [Bacteroides sp. OM08-17BH]RHJ54049.1 hypothetical protein DW121_03095 [Bacteroides sp. AM10-21B]
MLGIFQFGTLNKEDIGKRFFQQETYVTQCVPTVLDLKLIKAEIGDRVYIFYIFLIYLLFNINVVCKYLICKCL